MSSLSQFFMGRPGGFEQQSTLGAGQQPILQNLLGAAQNQGAGGAFGDVADYYRSLLSGTSPDFNALAAPELRRFQQEVIPGLSSQFANLGSGALQSSGYRNAVLQANTDLAERLASMRAGLRGQGAQGLMGIGQQSLGNYFQNLYRPRQAGFLEQIAPAVGAAVGAGLTGGASALPGALQSLLGFLQNKNSLQDQYSSGIATGPYGGGASYNPYTGIQ